MVWALFVEHYCSANLARRESESKQEKAMPTRTPDQSLHSSVRFAMHPKNSTCTFSFFNIHDFIRNQEVGSSAVQVKFELNAYSVLLKYNFRK